MNILLHICCGPCLIYPFARLKARGFKIHGLYYNPNIYPFSEYQLRLSALQALNREYALELDCPDYRESDFLQALGQETEAPARCLICWSLRLRKAAIQAKARGYAAFSTTLLVSPYQDQELLKQTGFRIGKETGIEFYYEDFRAGFRQAQAQAKLRGIYRQKYCGCRYSIKPQAPKEKLSGHI